MPTSLPDPSPVLQVALISSWWRDAGKGSGTAVGINGLSNGLAALGHEVTHIAPPSDDGRLRNRLLFNLTLPHRLSRKKFDLVVGFDWDGFLFRPPNRLPYAVGLKGVAADELRHERGISRLFMHLQSLLEGANARRATRVITPSRYSARISQAAYGLAHDRVSTVPEGIHLSAWPSATDRQIPGRILTVARQYRRKNTATLLSAMALLQQRQPTARLEVIGDGPELPALKAQKIRLGLNNVVFRGTVTETALKTAYAQASIFCLPSRQEGFGIAFLEAMAAGLPVVAGDAGAAPEVIRQHHTGLLVPPDDANALANALATLLTNPPLARRMGCSGRAAACHYDWQHVAQHFLNTMGFTTPAQVGHA